MKSNNTEFYKVCLAAEKWEETRASDSINWDLRKGYGEIEIYEVTLEHGYRSTEVNWQQEESDFVLQNWSGFQWKCMF